MTALVEFGALDDLATYIEAFPKHARTAARIALNDVTEDEGLAVYRKAIAEQVDFGPGYLNPERLGIRNKATDNNLRVVVSGRQRATSLARFARGQTPEGTRGKGVKVRVRAGGPTQNLDRAFLVRLRKGNADTRDGYNYGLAIRLQPGETIRNKKDVRRVQLDANVYLLYGPSVDQIFRDVAVTDTPPVLNKIGEEYFRQFFRLTGGNRRGR